MPRATAFQSWSVRVAMTMALGVIACSDAVVPDVESSISVVVTPESKTLTALGDTVFLEAVVRRALGGTVPHRLTWSSSDTAVATTITTPTGGVVTAVGNGTATIEAIVVQFGGSQQTVVGTAEITVSQAPRQFINVGIGLDTSRVALRLDSVVAVEVRDGRDHPIEGVPVQFAVVEGAGFLSLDSAATDISGRAAVAWTLDTVAGVQEATATVPSAADTTLALTFSVRAHPELPDSILIVRGSGQIGFAGTPLPDSLVVRVVDRHGNGLAAQLVVMTDSGGGSVSPDSAVTDRRGEARAHWTLGPTAGVKHVSAVAPLKGSPLRFSATAAQLAVASTVPDPMIEGAEATLIGVFDPAGVGNVVTMDGDTVAVTDTSLTALTVRVPVSDGCVPTRDVTVIVSAGENHADTLTARVRPPNVVPSDAGAQQILDDPTAFCLQLLPSGTAERFLVGVSATAPVDGVLTVTIAADAGADAPVAAPAVFDRMSPSLNTPPLDAESRMRRWERANLDPSRLSPAARPSAALMAAQAVGDSMTVRVPDVSGDLCSFTQIGATVRYVGPRAIMVTDDANAQSDSFLGVFPLDSADFESIAAQLDTIIPAVTEYFGDLGDMDANEGRVVLVFTAQANGFDVDGFVSAVDLFPQAVCSSSSEGEIFYGAAPDLFHSKVNILKQLPALLAHELTHLVQHSRRLGAGATLMEFWAAEGQAEIGREITAHRTIGNLAGQNYGHLTTDRDSLWYGPLFDNLAMYYGWNPEGGRFDNAPARCSLYGFFGTGVPCASPYVRGAAWSFFRYVTDRFGGEYAGGPTALHHDIIGADVNLSASATVERLVGVPFGTLMVQWAAMLHVDGREASTAGGTLEMASWNLFGIFNGFDESKRLTPLVDSLTAFTPQTQDLRGGGTAYFELSSAGAHPALAIRVRAGDGGLLGQSVGPVLWIVRLQ